MEDQVKGPPRVGFFFPHPLSYSLGSTARLFGLASNLRKLGVETCIITPFEKTGMVSGIKIVNIPNIFSRIGLGHLSYSLGRKISYNKLLCRLLLRNMKRTSVVNQNIVKILQEHKLDLLQIEHEPTAAAMLPILNKLSVPVLLDFHGIWAEELVENKIITRSSSEYSLLQSLVAEAVSRVDAVLVMSEAMKHYVITNYGSAPPKVHVIELFVEPKLTNITPKSAPPKIIYSGILSREKHAQLFLESIPYVTKEHHSAQFFITDRGDLTDEARGVAKTSGVHINFFWFPEQDDLFRLMTSCDVGALTLPNNDSYKLSPAAKFFDYLTAGLPVVSNDIGGWASIINEEQVGILTDDDPVEFSKGILRLIDNPTMAQDCGQRALDLARRRFNADKICRKLADLYSRLLN